MPHPLFALLLFVPQSMRITPSADVWVYANASEPGHDEYLRIWGIEGRGAPADAGDAGEMSFAYLKWDLSALPSGKKLTKATLIVTNVANSGLTLDQAKAAPLQARPVGTTFDEKTWTFDMLGKLLPEKDPKQIYGTGFPTAYEADKPTQIEIDLLKGPGDFGKAFADASASSGKQLGIALTSGVDMSSLGRAGIYKVYSRDTKEEALRPQLVLMFE